MAAEVRGIAARVKAGRLIDIPLSADGKAPAAGFAPPRKSVAARLIKEGFAFSFFQAIRLLESNGNRKEPTPNWHRFISLMTKRS